ncbi:helix-turn-helix transcriptional regulator (plasmid) [Halorarum halophilum]|uniref:Helix-turn-helix transcriptional regulator n=1 Tax=Halorarum halophilum TaxID=2743090 RepID=A0A7D5GHV2_9EURY|nr:helix-turn-helix transcriptional regulator [Halobaculum halophilum]QLG30068.1 helix-turn-helix transcriptional regulator [Halobaculum halophilum]
MSEAQTDPVHATTIDGYRVPTPDELRMLRRDLGVTQTQLATAVGSTQTTISQFELGNHDIMSSTLRDAVEFLQEEADGE